MSSYAQRRILSCGAGGRSSDWAGRQSQPAEAAAEWAVPSRDAAGAAAGRSHPPAVGQRRTRPQAAAAAAGAGEGRAAGRRQQMQAACQAQTAGEQG